MIKSVKTTFEKTKVGERFVDQYRERFVKVQEAEIPGFPNRKYNAASVEEVLGWSSRSDATLRLFDPGEEVMVERRVRDDVAILRALTTLLAEGAIFALKRDNTWEVYFPDEDSNTDYIEVYQIVKGRISVLPKE